MKNENKKLVEDLKERGIFSDCANIENFLELKEDQKCVYLGIDCTAESLHIGHLMPVMQAARLAKNKFKIIILLGGATSKIGDPSDKLKERPILPHDLLIINQKKIESQLNEVISKNEDKKELNFLPLSYFFEKTLTEEIYKILIGDEWAKKNSEEIWKDYLSNIWPKEINRSSFIIADNREWLDKLTFVDFIDKCGRNITINYLLSKETIKQRTSSENGLSFSAFSYSLLQAYDFLHLYKTHNCHGQLGASDQWGNFTTGLKMIKSFDPENKCFALAFNLILDESGKKISKSDAGTNVIWLSKEKTSPKNIFNYFSNMSDQKAIDYIKKFTFINNSQIDKLLKLNNPKSLRILQRILLELFFFLLRGRDGLEWVQINHKNIKNLK